jgi:hypothetical protein
MILEIAVKWKVSEIICFFSSPLINIGDVTQLQGSYIFCILYTAYIFREINMYGLLEILFSFFKWFI